MFELTLVGILLSAAHLAAVYVGTDILRMDYAQILAFNVAIMIVSSLLIRVAVAEWKLKLISILKQEKQEGDALIDVGLMILAFIAGGVGSAMLMYRRYGPVGWLGIIGSSALVNWIV